MAETDPANLDWLPQDSAMPSIVEQWRQQQARHVEVSISAGVVGSATLSAVLAAGPYPDVLVQAAVLQVGDRTKGGQLVEGVAIAWFEIIRQLDKDPEFLFKIPWRKLEEIVAGAYQREGWPEVVLTPRSGDGGIDVIASRPGVGAIRIFDQIKAYNSGHVVTAEEVDAMLGVLQKNPNVSKGVITTTGRFAPGIEKDSGLAAYMPYRLELKNGLQLREWLSELARKNRT